jgi:hypothetical protein
MRQQAPHETSLDARLSSRDTDLRQRPHFEECDCKSCRSDRNRGGFCRNNMPPRPTSAAGLPHTADKYSAGALIARRREIRMPKHASLFARRVEFAHYVIRA